MLNKIMKAALSAIILLVNACSAAPAFALTSDLQYDFSTENTEEFYNSGQTNINYDGAVPDYLHDIYDFTPQTVYDSEYGAMIITPTVPSQTPLTNAPTNAPVGSYTAASSQTISPAQSTGDSGESAAVTEQNLNIAAYSDYYNEETPQYPITPIEEVRDNDGSIGTLKIPKIGLSVTAYDGDTYAAMTDGDIKREVYVHLDQLCTSVYESSIKNPAQKISFFVPLDPERSPIQNANGRILLPARAIAETLGCKVDWDADNQTVIVGTADAKIVPPEDWVAAMEAHSRKYAPDFLELKSSWLETEERNQAVLAVEPTQPVKPPPLTDLPELNAMPPETSMDLKVFTVFDYTWNKNFDYSYKNPEIPANPPIVGSVPAQILIDEKKSEKLFIDNPDSHLDPIRNVTDPYYGGFTYGGCNWYAAGRFWENYGIPFPHFNEFLGAADYLDDAEKYDEFRAIRDIRDIRPMSIAVFVPDVSPSAHVLFIEYIERDAAGNPINVYFTEANDNNPTGRYRHNIDGVVKVLPYDKFINRGGQRYIGCIVPNPDFYK